MRHITPSENIATQALSFDQIACPSFQSVCEQQKNFSIQHLT